MGEEDGFASYSNISRTCIFLSFWWRRTALQVILLFLELVYFLVEEDGFTSYSSISRACLFFGGGGRLYNLQVILVFLELVYFWWRRNGFTSYSSNSRACLFLVFLDLFIFGGGGTALQFIL